MELPNLLQHTYFRGRVALHAILRAMDVGQGDEVATQAFTCLAVPEGIAAVGARPVYVDVTRDGYNLDAEDLRRKITPHTRAVVVQHTFGIPADMTPILRVAADHGVPVIEDCCHTLVSTYGGQPVGAFGIASFYSFEWGKPIVAGIGGSAATRDPDLRKRLEAAYDSLGMPGLLSRFKLEAQYWAYSFLYRPRLYWPVRSLFHRLSRLGAAAGNYNPVADGAVARDFSLVMAPQLRRRLARKLLEVDEHCRHAQWVSDQYRSGIASAAVRHPQPPGEAEVVYARYPMRAADKPHLLAKARDAGIEVAEWYATPVHPLGKDQCLAVHYEPESCPNAEERAREVISLPTHRRVKQAYIDQVTSFLSRAA